MGLFKSFLLSFFVFLGFSFFQSLSSSYAQGTFSAVKSVDKLSANPGERLKYEIRITNNGSDSLTNVSVTDDISSFYDYIINLRLYPQEGGNFDEASKQITWTISSISPGQETKVRFDLSIKGFPYLTSFPIEAISNTAIVNGVNTNTVTTAIIPYPPGNTTPKKGVGRGWGRGYPDELRALGVSWAYSWTIGDTRGEDSDFKQDVYEFVPMLHGIPNEEKVATIAALRKDNNLGHYWLIFNEPDYVQQQNISPEEGARRYKEMRELIKRYEPEARLIVGNVFFTDMGWLKNFRGKYFEIFQTWPEVEGWGVHLYMGWSNYNRETWRQTMLTIKNWMSPNGGQKELWLTEFGSLNSEETGRQIMEDQVPWLESQPWVTRYAWFATYANGPGCGTCTGSLLLSSGYFGGGLTDLGKLYATFGSPPPSPTPTPTPAFTLQFFSGWNSLFWQVGFPTNKKPSLLPSVCTTESSNVGTLWKPFVKTYGGDDSFFGANKRYPVWCRETVSWPFN